MWGDCGEAKSTGIILGSFQPDYEDPLPGDIWPEKRPQDCTQHCWSEESEAARSFPRGNRHESTLSFHSETKLPLTPVVQFYPCSKDNPAVTLTLQLCCGYGKSTYYQSNFHSHSIRPAHWALIWVNGSFSCRTSTKNMHSLCLRGVICLQ